MPCGPRQKAARCLPAAEKRQLAAFQSCAVHWTMGQPYMIYAKAQAIISPGIRTGRLDGKPETTANLASVLGKDDDWVAQKMQGEAGMPRQKRERCSEPIAPEAGDGISAVCPRICCSWKHGIGAPADQIADQHVRASRGGAAPAAARWKSVGKRTREQS